MKHGSSFVTSLSLLLLLIGGCTKKEPEKVVATAQVNAPSPALPPPTLRIARPEQEERGSALSEAERQQLFDSHREQMENSRGTRIPRVLVGAQNASPPVAQRFVPGGPTHPGNRPTVTKGP